MIKQDIINKDLCGDKSNFTYKWYKYTKKFECSQWGSKDYFVEYRTNHNKVTISRGVMAQLARLKGPAFKPIRSTSKYVSFLLCNK